MHRNVYGLPSPTFSVFEGQHIGSGRTKCVADKYGIAIANATVSGDHWRQRHDRPKMIYRDMFTSARQSCLVEYESLFNGKVSASRTLRKKDVAA